MQNNYMTTEYIANAFVNYTKLNLTFMGIANNDYEGMFENNKVFTPGDNISAIIPSYPRVMTGLDLTEYGNQGYTTQVYNINLEQDGLCNVLRSMDNYTEAFKIDKDKTWEQFILPTHKAIAKSIEYYIINKLNKSTTHCPVSSIQYKLMLKNWIAKSVSNNTPNNPVFINYVLQHKAYTEKMNYLKTPTLIVSPNSANYFRQSAMPLYTPSLVEKIAVDAYLGKFGSFEILQSPEIADNANVSGASRMQIKGPVATLPLKENSQSVVLGNSLQVEKLVFSRTNSFNLTWIEVKTEAGVKPVMWEKNESMCLYFGPNDGTSLALSNCIGLTNQISQLAITNHLPLLFLDKCEPLPANGDPETATEWWIKVTPQMESFIIGNNASTWRGCYLGPALSTTITSDERMELSKFMLEANAVGYNFEFGRVGEFTQKTIEIAKADVSISGAKPISIGDLVTKDGLSGLLDSYQYTTESGEQVTSEWGYGISEQGLTVINPPIGKVASADTTVAKDKETGKYSFRATYQGNNVQSNNYYRIDTLIGVGVVPIYSFAFPMPIGLAI